MKHVLNEYFDRIYCVTVATFHDRHELVRKQMQGIDFAWMYSPSSSPSDKLTASERSLIEGHVCCIKDAMANAYKRIAIWEDDGVFTATEDEMRTFLYAVPTTWDCLYLGNPSWCDDIWKLKTKPVSEHVHRIRWGNGCGFNAIQSPSFCDILHIASQGELPMDWVYNQIFKRGNTFCPAKGFFADFLSIPDPRVINKFPDLSKFIPSRVDHTN